MNTKQLNSQYVKDIETANDSLDTKNCKLSGENERLLKQLKQLQGANDELSCCLAILIERFGSDNDIRNIITKTLNSVAKKLEKQKY
jgi:hypothetical protein